MKEITKRKLFLAITLIIIGFIGVLSILTMEIALPAEAEAILKNKFTSTQIKLLTLINPTILLLVFVVIGTVLYQKVNLTVPIIEKLIGIRKDKINIKNTLKHGILGGVLAGILLSIISLIFKPFLPSEFIELGESLKPTLAARFLYGGFTEEILMRFGLMTLIVWIFSKILKNKKDVIFWLGISVAAIIFALGHFPIVYQSINNPSSGLLSYILIGNSIGGVIFGFLYWKKGLESAFIAHVFAHVIMCIAELF